VQLIVGHKGNLAVVGDADQSIYGWRGADIKNILKFEEDYPTAKSILLEQNYRSTQTILSAANKIIEKNIYRKKKNLFTKNVEGDKIKVYTAYDESDEANFVANTVRDLINQDKVDPNEIAVLFRANFQSRALEEACLRKNIPYTLLGTKFFERREVKDVLSYIRAALNPDSMSDLKRIINTPTRGIGKTTVLKIMEGKERDLPSATLMKVNMFRNILRDIEQKIKTEKASDVVKFVLMASGLERSHKEDGDDERLENVRELVTLATKFDDPEEFPTPSGVEKLLEEASLASDQDDLDKKTDRNAPANSIKLMTVHASKGLEFDYVFVTGLEHELFPHSRSKNEHVTPEQSEEERRLFYVAITRARKKLFLSHANVRTIFGSKQVNIPSEFIGDIDPELTEQEEPEVVSGIKSIFIDF
jgi:DNA helicase-2/ATP-dependent DNA helicase PcrA